MKSKERYQQYLDAAYQFAPFTLVAVIDLKDPKYLGATRLCDVCGQKRIRYLCQCTDRRGITWNIGRVCHTEIYNRQFREHLHGNT